MGPSRYKGSFEKELRERLKYERSESCCIPEMKAKLTVVRLGASVLAMFVKYRAVSNLQEHALSLQ